MTPEGQIKKLIQQLLDSYGLIKSSKAVNVTVNHTGKYHMPVPLALGTQGIPDFYGHFHGLFFEIEAKADEKKEPTPLQKQQLNATRVTGAAAFVVGGPESLKVLRDWLEAVKRSR